MDSTKTTEERRMSKITKSAQGQECTIRIPDICNGDPATTVLCHLPGGGMAGKRSDIHGAYGCSTCHAVVDGAKAISDGAEVPRLYITIWFYEGVFRTQEILLRDGLIKI